MSTTINKIITFSAIDCCSCHATFAITEGSERRLRNSHETFWCPYCGCGQSWQRESETERLRKKVAQLEDECKWADNRRRNAENETEAERRSKAAYKGQLTKVRRKVANGSCPCCNRHFENLQRHMQTKHPEYVAESNEEARKG